MNEHREWYGRPWIFGEHHVAFLRENGLLPSHRVLDFGCGAGRVGIPLLRYLGPENYVGIEQKVEALTAFRGEAEQAALPEPTLILGNTPTHATPGFDVVLDSWATTHIKDRPLYDTLFALFRRTLRPNGRLFRLARAGNRDDTPGFVPAQHRQETPDGPTFWTVCT